MTNRFVRLTVLALLPAWLLGCSASGVAPQGTAPSTGAASVTSELLDQMRICRVNKWQEDVTAASCTVGQKVAFLPDSWGNEQLPILFAAVNCDLRYTVVLTNGGVTCIYVGPLGPKHSNTAPDASASMAPRQAPVH